LLERLRKEMIEASEALNFERAAECRDQIRAVRKTVERQVVVMQDAKDRDVIGLAEAGDGLGLGLLYIRQGRLLDEKYFFWPGLTIEEGPEVLESFISQFYGPDRFIPSRIIVPAALDTEALGETLAERREGSVRIAAAATAQEKHLVEIARKVARRAREDKERISLLLQRVLKLPEEPARIECIDASHLGGEGMRVGMIVFEHGRRIKEDSRVYTFPELEGTGDDYAALASWVSRRLESGPPWPDLLLIDGGLGQLATVQRILEEEGAEDGWELASIAKGPTRRAGEMEDRIFRPGRKNHMPLKPGSPELMFLQRVRDEAHRFVIGRQRRSRKKRMLDSELLSMPGIGQKTARILWDRFGSLAAMQAAGIAEIEALPGIGRKRAEKIHAQLADMHQPGND